MKSFYILLLTVAISAVSCKTKDGAPGPAGASNLKKQGTISGTIAYTNIDGKAATAPFNYEYYESVQENAFTYTESGTSSYYRLQFTRRDLSDINNYFNFYLQGYGTNGVEDDPYSTSTEFSFVTVINNEIYAFYSEDIEITNLALDPTTGKLTYSFSGVAYDSEDNEVTVSGTANVVINRLTQNNVPSAVEVQ